MKKNGLTGIRQIKKTGRWEARISYTLTPGEHKEKVLGTFDIIEEAIASREHAQTLLAEGRVEEYVRPERTLTPRQASILTGNMLGDANLQKPMKPTHNSFFVVKQAHYRQEYLEWLFVEFGYLSQGICAGTGQSPSYPERKTKNLRFYTRAQPVFTKLRNKWYPEPDEIKIVPPDIQLDPLSIAIWFADDGTNRDRNGRFAFCTNSFTQADRELLVDKLKEFGLKSWTNESEKRLFISRSYRLDFHDLIIEHFPWECFKYKLNLKDRNPPRGRHKLVQ